MVLSKIFHPDLSRPIRIQTLTSLEHKFAPPKNKKKTQWGIIWQGHSNSHHTIVPTGYQLHSWYPNFTGKLHTFSINTVCSFNKCKKFTLKKIGSTVNIYKQFPAVNTLLVYYLVRIWMLFKNMCINHLRYRTQPSRGTCCEFVYKRKSRFWAWWTQSKLRPHHSTLIH